MDAHIQALQDQVDTLFNNLNSLRNHVDASVLGSDPSPFPDNQYARSMSISQASAQGPQSNGRAKPPQPQQQPKHPRFHGPTSNAFNLGVAKANLQSIGITATDDNTEEGVFTQDATPLDSPRLAPLAPPPSQHTAKPVLHTTKDPMWAINKDEAIRLCHVWHEEMGLMYPVLDIEATIRHATLLYTFMEAAHRTRLVEVSFPGADSISDDQTIILKLVLATALILEGSGKSELGTAMFQSIRPNVEAVLLASVNVRGIKMLTLTVSRPQRSALFASNLPRACIIFTEMKRTRLGASSAWPHACAWNLACIAVRRTAPYSSKKRSALLQFGCSGLCTCLIEDGRSAPACRSPSKTRTSTPTCQSRLVMSPRVMEDDYLTRFRTTLRPTLTAWSRIATLAPACGSR